MDIVLGEDDQMVRGAFRDFFTNECPAELVREVEDDDLDYSRDLYAAMAGLGMLSLPFHQTYGGQDGHLFHLGLLYEEMGRALAPTPHLSAVVLCGMLIAEAGREEQRLGYLPAIGAGDLIGALALTETAAGASGVAATASIVDDAIVLNGVKRFVRHGAAADFFIVAVRAEGSAGEDGISLFIVPAGAEGLALETYRIMSGERLTDLTLDGVRLPEEALLGEWRGGWPPLARALDYGRAMLACEMVGGAEALLERTVEHCKQRHTFGRPIGANQALQHRLARIKMDLDRIRLLARRAAWRLGEGEDASLDAAAAKVGASALYRLAANEAVQMHGGYGVAKETDIQLYWRRHKALEVYLGDSQSLKDEMAEALGL